MSPKSLIKNIPAPNQQWKAPVKVWIRDLYEEKFGKVLTAETGRSDKTKGNTRKHIQSACEFDNDELPF